MEDPNIDDGDQNRETEIAPALIAVHPAHQSVAVAVGSDLRVFNLQEGCAVTLGDGDDLDGKSSTNVHKDSIRAIRYGANNGTLFVSAGDDKLVKIWATTTWRCISTVVSEKKVSAVAIRSDGLFVCFADKFGVVYVVDTQGISGEQGSTNEKGIPILSHYCSIITSLEFSPDSRFIISADRDFKIRVSVFPKNPLDGAHEIQSFCLGHTEFVSCLAFVFGQDYPQGLLISGSGDSTVRLWDFTCGALLDTCAVGTEAGYLETDGKEGECRPAVTDLCATKDGSLVAVALQSLPGIMLLSCDISARTLSVLKVVSISEDPFIPTSLGSGSLKQFLWMVMGVSSLQGSDLASLARVRVLSGFSKSNIATLEEHKASLLDDKDIPGRELVLQKLQGTLSIEKEVLSSAAEAVKTAMRNLLIKKHYPVEKREYRKRGRNDRKNKQR
ncbi:uncharacterized protein [Coffea arabica]|uniref:tRNA (guanine-N(7)-)-methyltransferase non-catalytic subunit n=1 Tax=Coffea arabica TaxID=13443 RepID=A0A6P6WJM9_COFAR|nr:tRNA (guanine-N(7)-)-methyltransferase non-catalytic subunit wdr4-like [Coffea arabica]